MARLELLAAAAGARIVAADLGGLAAHGGDGEPRLGREVPEFDRGVDEVFDPRTLEPLAYPEYVEAALRTEIEALCDDLRNGGRAGRSAKRRLEEIGHPALVGVINAYQKIDFKDPNQALFAFEMNKLLTDSFGAGVVSTNFKVTLAGEPIPPETSDWNAKTVNAWRRFWGMYPEKEKWEAMIARRKEGKGNEAGK